MSGTRADDDATTIVIAARNASATIERAVSSALAQGDYPLLLVDDHSEDGTVSLAQAVAGDRLRIVRPAHHGPLGFTRQTGLMAIGTPYAAWLDADDEFLPGRLPRLLHQLKSDGADLAFDAAELADDRWTATRALAPIPPFLTGDSNLARQFERNYLPAPGAPVFRTAVLRELGYDVALHGAEDMDVILRASLARRRFTLAAEPGYTIHALPSSQSRQRQNQRAMYRAALLKHAYGDVETLFFRSGYGARTTMWALLSMAAFRQEWKEALGWLDRIESLPIVGLAIVEPDGPSPFPERWRLAFWRGTLLLHADDGPAARRWLTIAETLRPSPEGANNLGVAERLAGNRGAADALFAIAAARLPHYEDALMNLRNDAGGPYVTTHPFRVHRNRTDYETDPAGPDTIPAVA